MLPHSDADAAPCRASSAAAGGSDVRGVRPRPYGRQERTCTPRKRLPSAPTVDGLDAWEGHAEFGVARCREKRSGGFAPAVRLTGSAAAP